MKKSILFLLAVIVSAQSFGQTYSYTTSSRAQERYDRVRTRHGLIDWRPEAKTMQRYTLSVSPLRLFSNGLKFDFEKELGRPGRWISTGLTIYYAPEIYNTNQYWNTGDNNRWSYFSGGDDFHRMWGVGTSLFYKDVFSHRGWYYAAGAVLEFFRVGRMENDYQAYVEDNLTFYNYTRSLINKNYVKPAVQIYIGKHMAISERCYFDMFAGLGAAFSIYDPNNTHLSTDGNSYDFWGNIIRRSRTRYSAMNGFAYRGFYPVAGFRFGVMLWDARNSD